MGSSAGFCSGTESFSYTLLIILTSSLTAVSTGVFSSGPVTTGLPAGSLTCGSTTGLLGAF